MSDVWCHNPQCDSHYCQLRQAQANLSLAEEGLANYAQEVAQLREAFRQLRLGICLHATDTVWAGPAETAVDFITRHLADEWTEDSLPAPQLDKP